MKRLYGWKFAMTIALPLLLASLGVAWLTLDLVGRVSYGANTADHERTRQVVNSALSAARQLLDNVVNDNANWDDGARKVYGDIDDDWIFETWGAPTEDGLNYNAILIIDRDSAKAVAGYRKGQKFAPVTNDYLGGRLDAVLAELPREPRTFGSMSAIVNTPDGLAVIAAAPVLPTSDDVVIPRPMPRYLLFVKFLSPDYVAAIGEQYVIQDLSLAASETASGGLAVDDLSGSTLAYANWTDRRPGDAAFAAISRKAMVVLCFLALVLAGIGYLCWRLITEIARREAKAKHESLCDALTGLPNRAALNAAVSQLTLAGVMVSVAFADLDGFKEVNDTYDHETGDRLIQSVAAGLSHLAVRDGVMHRLGGDEFVALFSGDKSEERACAFARQFNEFIKHPFDLNGRMAAIGASIGIATMGGSGNDPQELMRRADIAMYKAKGSGKNRYVVYSAELDTERTSILSLADELRDIISSGTIEIAYQPVVNAATRMIIGVEALARWPSTSRQRVTPDKFIKVAESQGLIDDLADAILAKACTDALGWAGLRVSVNISPVQLKNPDFVRRTLNTIAKCGLAFDRVELEITESTLVDDIEDAQQIFSALHAAGIHIALDDFGAGYSSIGYLRQLKFDRIKIDRSLINQVLLGPAEQHVVQGALLMASGLTATVTAEGVECGEQINVLRLGGCTDMQGYYFFKPMPADEMSRLMSSTLAPVGQASALSA